MTFIQSLHPDALVHADAAADAFFAEFPAWEVSEGYGDRFVGEADMVLPNGADLTVWAVSDADFDAMCEALWVDPAERQN
jgi:hypothetical protein